MYERVISHMWMSPVTRSSDDLMRGLYVEYDVFVCVTEPIHMCDMKHSYERSIQTTDMTHCMSDNTGSYVWMTHACVWHDSFIWLYRRSSIATDTNESCHIYEWFMPRIHKCAHEGVLDTIASQSHFWGTQVTHMNESCLRQTHEWVMSHMWVSYVTHMNELHFWMAHGAHVQYSTMWMSHVKQMKDLCQTYEWVTSYIWTLQLSFWMSHKFEWVMSHMYSSIDRRCTQRSHVAYMNESCHTYKWALSHIWMSHVTRTNKSWHSYEWVTSHIYSRINRRWPERCSRAHRHQGTMSHTHSYVWHDLSICVTHSYTWHGSFTCMIVVIHVHVCDITIHMWDMTHSYVWLIHMCDMTRLYLWHDSSICVTGLQGTSSHTHPYAWHDSFTCVTWLIHMCDMAYSYGWHVSFICVTCPGTKVQAVMVVCDMNHLCVTWHI